MRLLTCVGKHRFASYPGIEVDEITSSHGEGIPLFPNPRQMWSRIRSIYRYRGKPDVILVEAFGGAYFRGSLRRMIKRDYERMIMAAVMAIAKRTGAKLAVIDHSDDLTVHPVNRPLLAVCDLYFKRELAVDPWRSLESLHGGTSRTGPLGFRPVSANQRMMSKLRPISLGFTSSEKQALEIAAQQGVPSTDDKIADIFYAGENSYRPLREKLHRELADRIDSTLRLDMPEEKLEFQEFASRIHRSWLCLSPPGLGWDCHRHYEAAVFGTVPVLSNPDIQLHQGFVHGKNAIFYDPHRPFLPQLEPWLVNREDLVRMAKAAKEHVLTHHTLPARSKAIIQQVDAAVIGERLTNQPE